MKKNGPWIAITSLAACLCLSTVASAEDSKQAAGAPRGEAVVSQVEVTATVVKIDHKTREVTLKTHDGSESTLVVDPAVRNLPQVKKGDVVTATYTEAIAYEVKKGGTAAAEKVTGAAVAPAGAKPAGVIGQKTTLTVSIVAIDTKAPSVTFKGPGGQTRTIKVMDRAKLQGVNVGDTVDITYAEALAIKVEKAPKK